MSWQNINYHKVGSHWSKLRTIFSLKLPFGLTLTLTRFTTSKDVKP